MFAMINQKTNTSQIMEKFSKLAELHYGDDDDDIKDLVNSYKSNNHLNKK